MQAFVKLFSTYLFLSFSWPVIAETTTTILNNGSAENRVDIVVVGDGYTTTEMQKYAADVQKFIDGFFAESPYKEYKSYFNIHKIEVISNESGADHPENNEYKDTALNAHYNCANIQRLICVNTSKVNIIINNNVSAAEQDIKLVLVNDSTYGGSGGAVAVASTHSSVVELVLHEIGHSFGLLADEYSYGTCNNSNEPPQANVTKETRREFIKWNINDQTSIGWVNSDTNLPTNNTTLTVIGLYQGAKYCSSKLYRPTYNSKMRSLGQPYGQINEEQLIKRIYNFVSPLDSSLPIQTSISVNKGHQVNFQVDVMKPVSQDLDITWSLDNQVIRTGSTYDFDTAEFNIGTYNITVDIHDKTLKVRNDLASVLKEHKQWFVMINKAVDSDSDGIPDYLDSDDDNDGMSDVWELEHGLNALLDIDAGFDNDADALTNLEEFKVGTNPNSIDTDNDGIPDKNEILSGRNPTVNEGAIFNAIYYILDIE